MNNRSHLVRVVRLFPCPKNRPMREPGVFTFQFLNVKIDHNTKFAKLTIVKWLLWYNCNVYHWKIEKQTLSTGKLCQKLTHPQYADRLFIELQVQYMKIPSSNLGRTCCVQKFFLASRTIFVHNMFSPCSAKRRASDKDLPVCLKILWRHFCWGNERKFFIHFPGQKQFGTKAFEQESAR